MARWRPFQLGWRREAAILLPAGLLLVVLLSTLTLVAYRGALDEQWMERRTEAAVWARTLAPEAEAGSSPTKLLSQGATILRVALLDERGDPLSAAGEPPFQRFPGELEEGAIFGPEAPVEDAVVALVAVEGLGEARYLRVDLPARGLAARRSSAWILTWVVIGIDLAAVGLLLALFRQLMAPWRQVLERARSLQPELQPTPIAEGGATLGEEVQVLISALERAMEALHDRMHEKMYDKVQDRHLLVDTEEAGGEGNGAEPGGEIGRLGRTLESSAESGLLLLDGEGRLLAINAVGMELLGLEGAATLGLRLERALAPCWQVIAVLRQAVARGSGIQRLELPLAGPEQSRLLGMTVHVLRRPSGSPRGFLALFTDLTEVHREARQARLVESLAQLGEMAGGIAHELRNSLGTFRGYLDLLERRPDAETASEYRQEMRQEAENLERVLEDFLAFARPGTARFQPLDLGELVRAAASDPSLGEVTLKEDGGGLGPGVGGGRVLGDRQLLLRALRNLLHNACRAQREAGSSDSVELRWAMHGEEAVITIVDRGPGVPRAVRERLFQPFATGSREGAGLGLALVHRIVSLHRGSIDLRDREGGGTLAEVRIPADKSVTIGSDGVTESARPNQ
ncbi:MAG: ATP-binding protein [Acidobacteriota bacterium]